jgi:ubiquinone/menaquinone biosynthesis C-methylase UbiE
MEPSLVEQHFDAEAQQYDMWKARNWHYYNTIKRLYRERIDPASSVLEVGCGTGDILAHVAPKNGIGLDLSSAMIERAKQKHPALQWYACRIEDLHKHTTATFDVVFLSDVIEHLEDVPSTFKALRPYCHAGTTVYINMANPLWEPALMLLEKMGKKMPEGPHYRISVATLNGIMKDCGFQFRKRSHHLLMPKYIPVISPVCDAIEKLPLVRRLCLIEMLEYGCD